MGVLAAEPSPLHMCSDTHLGFGRKLNSSNAEGKQSISTLGGTGLHLAVIPAGQSSWFAAGRAGQRGMELPGLGCLSGPAEELMAAWLRRQHVWRECLELQDMTAAGPCSGEELLGMDPEEIFQVQMS